MTPSIESLLRHMAGSLAPWLATYLAHSLLLLSGALLVARWVRSSSAREVLWKLALVGSLVTATWQICFDAGPSLHWIPGESFESGAEREPILLERGLGPATASAADVQSLVAFEGSRPLATARPTTAPEMIGAAGSHQESLRESTPLPWTVWLLVAWALLAAISLAHLLLAHERFRKSLGERRRIESGCLRATLNSLCRRVGERAPVLLTQSSRLGSPIVLGRREICVPERVSELSEAEQEALLAHELAHIVRRDPQWLRLANLLERAFFFQPLQRMLRRRLQEDVELETDRLATTRLTQPVHLARCLAHVAEWIEREPASQLAPGMARAESDFVRRIELLLEPGSPKRQRRARRIAFGFMACLLVSLGYGGPHVQGEAGRQPLPQSKPQAQPTSRPVPGPTSQPCLRATPAASSRPALQRTPGQTPTLRRPTSERTPWPITEPIAGPTSEAQIIEWTEPREPLEPTSRELQAQIRIEAGDVVRVYDASRPKELDVQEIVQIEGDILLPELGRVEVAGKTSAELTRMLREMYRRYYQHTDVHVQIRRAQRSYCVLGEVLSGGQRRLSPRVTVLEAVMAAGPIEGRSDLERVRLIRPSSREPVLLEVDVRRILVTGDSSFNVLLQDRDILYILPLPRAPATEQSRSDPGETATRDELLRMTPGLVNLNGAPPDVALEVGAAGHIRVGEDLLYDPNQHEQLGYEKLTRWLQALAQTMDKETSGAARNLPKGGILIRAESGASFGTIQEIMQICGKAEVSIWRIEFAVPSAPDPVAVPIERQIPVPLPIDVAVREEGAPGPLRIRIQVAIEGLKIDLTGGPWSGRGPFEYRDRSVDYEVRFNRDGQELTYRPPQEATQAEKLEWLGEFLKEQQAEDSEVEGFEQMVVIDALPGTIYSDVVALLDCVLEQGFERIVFTGSRTRRGF